MHRITFAALSLVVALAAGCIQTVHEFTLNPDGSGKLAYGITMPLTGPGLGDDADADPAARAKEAVRDILGDSEGVDAWSDVAYEVTPEKKLRFKGTAYFPDVAAVKIHQAGGMQDSALKIEKLAGGAFRVQISQDDGDAKPDAPIGKITNEQADAQIAEARAQYLQMKPMMSAMLTGLRAETTFHFPGAVAKSTNMTRPDPRSARCVFEGEKMQKVMDAMMADDAALRAMIASGRDVNQQGPGEEALNEKLFGERGPILTESAPADAARFDYAAEVAAARAGHEAMMKRIGIAAPAVAIAAGPGGGADKLKGARVVGVRLVTESDIERGVRPFNADAGYALAIMLELGGTAIETERGELKEAVTDTGANLLPEERFDRSIHFPHLSEDGTMIVFEASMKLPPPDAAAIKRVAGTMTYLSADGTRSVDLGTVKLVKGAKGAELEAEIVKAAKSDFNPGFSEIELKLAASPRSVKEVRFLDAAGKAIEITRSGYFGGGGEVTLSFSREGDLPASAKIVVELHDKLTKHTAAWSLQNVTLLGQPIPKTE